MSTQDATFIVTYTDEQSREKRGTLKVQHANGNITFSFYGSDRHPLPTIPDNICNLADFTVFEILPSNDTLISFSGPNAQMHFSFTRDGDKAKFMDFISTKVRVIPSNMNPSLFLLESIDFGESAFFTKLLPNATAPTPPKRISLDNFKDFTKKEEPECIKINKDNVRTQKLYNADIDDSVIFDAFQSLLYRPKTDDDAEYKDVKQQWKSIIPRQFVNHKNLQELIKNLEADIKAHENLFKDYEDPKRERLKKIAFNILLSYSIYNWDGALYYNGLIELLFPFIDAYVKQYGFNFNDDDCESDIFSIFDVFYEENHFSELKKPGRQAFIKDILPVIGQDLKNIFEDLLSLLLQKHVSSLDFLRDDISRWFVDVFKTNDVQRLWISILAFNNIKEFYRSFLIALLFYISPSLNELNPLSFEEFVERFNDAKCKADLKTLLLNTQKIHEMLTNEEKKPQE